MNWIQYAYLLFAVSGAFLVTGAGRRARFWGFVAFIISNSCMMVWAWAADVPTQGVFITHAVFFALAVKGAITNRKG